MARIVQGLSGIAVATALTLGVAGAPTPVVAGDPCYHGFALPPRSAEAGTEVKAMECAFAPTVTWVPVGATVTFFNGPEVAHLVTGANQEWGSRDEELAPNATVSYTFDTAGVYPYACALHRGMSGTIIVGQPAAPAAGGSGAAGTTAAGDPPPARFDASGALLAAGAGLAGLALLVVAWVRVVGRRAEAGRSR